MESVQWRFMDEMCIVVDEADNQIGADTKKNCHLINKENGTTLRHRAFSVFLFDSRKRLLLQKRSAEKITFPLYWANTCCSHPLNTGEETEVDNHLGVKRAAIRKLHHELGIPLDTFRPEDFTNVLTVRYSAHSDDTWGESEVDHVLFVQKDVELCINPSEVCEAKFMTYEEILELLSQEDHNDVKVSPWFRKIMNYLGDSLFRHVDDIQSVVREGIISL